MKILHLFDDLMNLYGEYANLLVLERELSKLGQEVQIHTLRMGEQKDISDYDMYYMGAGTERKQKLALAELRKYAPALKKAKEDGRSFSSPAMPSVSLDRASLMRRVRPMKHWDSSPSKAPKVAVVFWETATAAAVWSPNPL